MSIVIFSGGPMLRKKIFAYPAKNMILQKLNIFFNEKKEHLIV